VSEVVSIYIPTKNRPHELDAAISSVMHQTYPYIELVIVDDGSSVDISPVVQKHMGQRPILFLRNEQSLGGAAARNKAILAASGTFVTGLDDDDILEPYHISALVDYWNLLTRCGQNPLFLYTQRLFVWDDGKGGGRISSHSGSISKGDFFRSNPVGNQIFVRRTDMIRAGLFDNEMPAWQDIECFYRVFSLGGTAHLLDLPSYIFNDQARPRISTSGKENIVRAGLLMYKKHGKDDATKLQQILCVLFHRNYGFPLELRDLKRFKTIGLPLKYWPSWLSRFLLDQARREMRFLTRIMRKLYSLSARPFGPF
jgi:glycosyltransferase involved in cell wall biosynthesis